MLVRFTKMHGLGNDFVVLDLISQDIQIHRDQIIAMADRREGVGFDQLLTVQPPDNPDMDFRYRIFNADGSEAEQCGNGARCLTQFVRDEGLATRDDIKLETNAGCIQCELLEAGEVRVDMGSPQLLPERIPFLADSAQITYSIDLSCDQSSICLDTSAVDVGVISMGNPHAVLTVDCVESAKVPLLGPLLESHGRFPERVNVGFMEIVDAGHIRLRVFERGVGETRACGTGACAAVVAGRLQGLLDEQVNVDLPGGRLRISWEGDNHSVMLTGPTCRVYEGRTHI